MSRDWVSQGYWICVRVTGGLEGKEHQQHLCLRSISNLLTQHPTLIRSLMGSVSHLTPPHTCTHTTVGLE